MDEIRDNADVNFVGGKMSEPENDVFWYRGYMLLQGTNPVYTVIVQGTCRAYSYWLQIASYLR